MVSGKPQGASVFLEGSELVIRNFREDDPEVVRAAHGTADKEFAARTFLRIGARAAGVAQATLESRVVQEAFGEMAEAMKGAVTDAATRISTAAANLLDEDHGDLRRILNGVREQIDRDLGDIFDVDSKSSPVSRIGSVLEKAAEEQVDAVRRIINPHAPDSPLGQWRIAVEGVVKEQAACILKALSELSERVAVDRARTELMNKMATKGFSFEELVHAAVARIAATLGDIAERVSGALGTTARKSGDELVHLNPEDTRGSSARYVLENKDRKLPLKNTLDELDLAMANREAAAAIAVFSSHSNAPIDDVFQTFGNKSVLVFDKDDPDERALRLACTWARWVVRRQVADADRYVDLGRMETLIEDAKRALNQATVIRRALAAAGKKVEEARTHFDGLVDEVEDALQALGEEISRAEEEGPGAQSRAGRQLPVAAAGGGR